MEEGNPVQLSLLTLESCEWIALRQLECPRQKEGRKEGGDLILKSKDGWSYSRFDIKGETGADRPPKGQTVGS